MSEEKIDSKYLKMVFNARPKRAIQYLDDFHRTRFIHISQRKTHDRHASEDIVQEAMSEIWERREWIIRQENIDIEKYLITIIINKSCSWFRQIKRMENSRRDMVDDNEGFVRDAISLELLEPNGMVWNVLAAFPAREYQCISLKYKNSLTNDEIGLQLGVTRKSVERAVTRAYKRLRSLRHLFR